MGGLEFSLSLKRSRICLWCRRPGFDPWIGKFLWRKEWQLTPVFLPGEFHGQRSLAGYSLWGLQRVGHDWATHTHTHTHTHTKPQRANRHFLTSSLLLAFIVKPNLQCHPRRTCPSNPTTFAAHPSAGWAPRLPISDRQWGLHSPIMHSKSKQRNSFKWVHEQFLQLHTQVQCRGHRRKCPLPSFSLEWRWLLSFLLLLLLLSQVSHVQLCVTP